MAEREAVTLEEAMGAALERGEDVLRALSLDNDEQGGYLIPKQLDGKKHKIHPES